MDRSWLVTTALCFAATAATLQGTHAIPQPATPAPQATTPAAPAAPTAGKQATTAPKTAPMGGGHLTMPSQLTWDEAPPALPRGAHATVLAGDPGAKSGAFTVRLKMPDGYKVMPHTHPSDEYVTVLSGALRVGMSRSWDEAGMKELPVGGFAHMPANTAHYVKAHGQTVLQVSGQSPFSMTYINAADDPRNAAPATSTRR